MSELFSIDAFAAEFAAAVLETTTEPLPENFSLDTRFSDLDLDSLSRLEVITALEDRLDIALSDAMLNSATSPRDLYDALVGRDAE